MSKWRPENWKNPYRDKEGSWERLCFERGADAMLEALFQLAKESPTGTFIIDSKTVTIQSVEDVK